MFTELFGELGLSKNESEIYESLLKYGELSAGQIAIKAKVHRRNVYDAIGRLVEKGLVFEIFSRKENRYQAVEPGKLLELVREKEARIQAAMPALESLYKEMPQEQAVYVYRGIEGWKNYLQDILRLGADFYCIGGKGAWMDSRAMTRFPKFIKDANTKGITFHHLFDHEVRKNGHDIIQHVGKNYKFFPEGYSTPASIDVFGDRVNMVSNVVLGGVDDDLSFTVIVNQQIADACRTWFKFMWDFFPEESN